MIKLKSYSKINLNLYVGNVRKDGFHAVLTKIIPVKELYDILEFSISNENILISNVDIKDNIIKKTVLLFQKKYNLTKKVKINLKKNIPIGAGLGGGSSNCATTLLGLNKLYNLNLPIEELEKLAKELGTDTVFFLHNKPAIATGRGEILEFEDGFDYEELTLIIMPYSFQTKDIYKGNYPNKRCDLNKIKENIKEIKDNQKYYLESKNDLLISSLNISKQFKKDYEKLKKIYPDIKMTGSGPTLFFMKFDRNTKKLSILPYKNIF